MHTIKLRMRPFQIAAIMTALRRWLRARRAIPLRFHYDVGDDEMLVVKMEFAADIEADAFAGAFCRTSADSGRPRRDKEHPAGDRR
jgi:hypothetical protein